MDEQLGGLVIGGDALDVFKGIVQHCVCVMVHASTTTCPTSVGLFDHAKKPCHAVSLDTGSDMW